MSHESPESVPRWTENGHTVLSTAGFLRDPVRSGLSTHSEGSVESVEPVHSGDSVGSAEPVDSGDSGDSVHSGDSVESVEPVHSVDSGDSWTPWTPGGPGRPSTLWRDSAESADFAPGPLETSLETASRRPAPGAAVDFEILDHALALCIWRVWRICQTWRVEG
jgi:hypothetical protein